MDKSLELSMRPVDGYVEPYPLVNTSVTVTEVKALTLDEHVRVKAWSRPEDVGKDAVVSVYLDCLAVAAPRVGDKLCVAVFRYNQPEGD